MDNAPIYVLLIGILLFLTTITAELRDIREDLHTIAVHTGK